MLDKEPKSLEMSVWHVLLPYPPFRPITALLSEIAPNQPLLGALEAGDALERIDNGENFPSMRKSLNKVSLEYWKGASLELARMLEERVLGNCSPFVTSDKIIITPHGTFRRSDTFASSIQSVLPEVTVTNYGIGANLRKHLFHGTGCDNLPSILERGLTPIKPYGEFAEEDFMPAIFMSSYPRQAWSYATQHGSFKGGPCLIVLDRKRMKEDGLRVRYIEGGGRPLYRKGKSISSQSVRHDYTDGLSTVGCHEQIHPTHINGIWFPERYLFDDTGKLKAGLEPLLNKIRSNEIEILAVPQNYHDVMDRLVAQYNSGIRTSCKVVY